MDAWYKITSPRKEVREGRSFNPDEFAIHMEQIIAGTAPDDYKIPKEWITGHKNAIFKLLQWENRNEQDGIIYNKKGSKVKRSLPESHLEPGYALKNTQEGA